MIRAYQRNVANERGVELCVQSDFVIVDDVLKELLKTAT